MSRIINDRDKIENRKSRATAGGGTIKQTGKRSDFEGEPGDLKLAQHEFKRMRVKIAKIS